jgi:hypothetical protein
VILKRESRPAVHSSGQIGFRSIKTNPSATGEIFLKDNRNFSDNKSNMPVAEGRSKQLVDPVADRHESNMPVAEGRSKHWRN